MNTTTTPGHTRVKLLKAATYAREDLSAGMVAMVDTDTATRWIKAKVAVVAPAVATKVVQTTCPKCGAAMEYPATPAPDQRWTQCRNPRCGHGWLR